MSGRAAAAQAHPTQRCKAVLKGLRLEVPSRGVIDKRGNVTVCPDVVMTVQ